LVIDIIEASNRAGILKNQAEQGSGLGFFVKTGFGAIEPED
jgi:hypothetical protein